MSLFGPLFDGALVPRDSLPALVRATAINGLRALRSSLIGSRGRYVHYMHTPYNAHILEYTLVAFVYQCGIGCIECR